VTAPRIDSSRPGGRCARWSGECGTRSLVVVAPGGSAHAPPGVAGVATATALPRLTIARAPQLSASHRSGGLRELPAWTGRRRRAREVRFTRRVSARLDGSRNHDSSVKCRERDR